MNGKNDEKEYSLTETSLCPSPVDLYSDVSSIEDVTLLNDNDDNREQTVTGTEVSRIDKIGYQSDLTKTNQKLFEEKSLISITKVHEDINLNNSNNLSNLDKMNLLTNGVTDQAVNGITPDLTTLSKFNISEKYLLHNNSLNSVNAQTAGFCQVSKKTSQEAFDFKNSSHSVTNFKSNKSQLSSNKSTTSGNQIETDVENVIFQLCEKIDNSISSQNFYSRFSCGDSVATNNSQGSSLKSNSQFESDITHVDETTDSKSFLFATDVPQTNTTGQKLHLSVKDLVKANKIVKNGISSFNSKSLPVLNSKCLNKDQEMKSCKETSGLGEKDVEQNGKDDITADDQSLDEDDQAIDVSLTQEEEDALMADIGEDALIDEDYDDHHSNISCSNFNSNFAVHKEGQKTSTEPDLSSESNLSKSEASTGSLIQTKNGTTSLFSKTTKTCSSGSSTLKPNFHKALIDNKSNDSSKNRVTLDNDSDLKSAPTTKSSTPNSSSLKTQALSDKQIKKKQLSDESVSSKITSVETENSFSRLSDYLNRSKFSSVSSIDKVNFDSVDSSGHSLSQHIQDTENFISNRKSSFSPVFNTLSNPPLNLDNDSHISGFSIESNFSPKSLSSYDIIKKDELGFSGKISPLRHENSSTNSIIGSSADQSSLSPIKKLDTESMISLKRNKQLPNPASDSVCSRKRNPSTSSSGSGKSLKMSNNCKKSRLDNLIDRVRARSDNDLFHGEITSDFDTTASDDESNGVAVDKSSDVEYNDSSGLSKKKVTVSSSSLIKVIKSQLLTLFLNKEQKAISQQQSDIDKLTKEREKLKSEVKRLQAEITELTIKNQRAERKWLNALNKSRTNKKQNQHHISVQTNIPEPSKVHAPITESSAKHFKDANSTVKSVTTCVSANSSLVSSSVSCATNTSVVSCTSVGTSVSSPLTSANHSYSTTTSQQYVSPPSVPNLLHDQRKQNSNNHHSSASRSVALKSTARPARSATTLETHSSKKVLSASQPTSTSSSASKTVAKNIPMSVSEPAVSGSGVIDLTDDDELSITREKLKASESKKGPQPLSSGLLKPGMLLVQQSNSTTSAYTEVTAETASQVQGPIMLANAGPSPGTIVVSPAPASLLRSKFPDKKIVVSPSREKNSSTHASIPDSSSSSYATSAKNGPLRPSKPLESLHHPAPLPLSQQDHPNNPAWKELPQKPALKISRVQQGIVLSWNMSLSSATSEITDYQLFAYQEGKAAPASSLWRKVGDVKALPLPMACTLTQFQEGHRYHFAVRAVDIHKRHGPFSEATTIHLVPP